MIDAERMVNMAIGYIDRGWRIIPLWGAQDGRCDCGRADCSSPAKHPHGRLAPHGLKDATADAAAVCSWFADGRIVNIGIATGLESGIVVLDVDVPHGGDDSLTWIELPETATVKTGNGRHLYFAWPPGFDIRNSAGKLGPGLDIRAAGGYVVAPPSLHIGGRTYTWLRDPCEGIADLPASLRQLLLEVDRGQAGATPAPQAQTRADDTWARAVAYAAAWEGVGEGRRNEAAFYHAAQLRNDFALDEAQTIELLRTWNSKNDPPLPDKELCGCVKSAATNSKFTRGAKLNRPPARGRTTAHGRKSAESPGDDSTGGPPALCEPVLTCMADVAPAAIGWLWPRRVPRGRITLVPGPPGEGKSIVTTYMAGRVSTGSPWPDGAECPRGSVILISAEDDPADTIRPRLDAHHADVRRIHLLTMVRRFSADGQPHECFFSLADVDALELALQAHPDCVLVVIDPIGSFVGGRTDTNRDNEVRSVLAPVAALAAKYGPAVVVVAHHRKGRGDRADDLVLGSKAFSGIARVVWHVTRDRENRARRLFLAGKNNLAPEGDGLAFTIGGDPPAICWERDPVRMNANDALAENGDDLAGATGEAVTWLRDLLADGRMRSTEIQHLAKKEGIALSTLKRAKRQAGVVAVRDGFGALSWWWWELPKGFKDAHT